MQGNNFDIIFLIAVSAYLAIKLFSILGKKNEQDTKVEAQRPAASLPEILRDKQKPINLPNTTTPQQPVFKNNIDEFKFSNELAKSGLKEVIEIDPSFNIGMFVEGSKIAFEMVLKAFSQNDKNTLKGLLSDEMFANFEKLIDENIAKKLKVTKSLVGIDSVEFSEVSINSSDVNITLKFLTEQINTVKDSLDNVIEGDSKNIETVEDILQFQRNIKSSNPNWTITSL
jgi:predicted lipid-binding transport protein (Tim44 family)